ncbi:MAG: hypothetical protein PHP86_01980 [Nevskiales bacterium]|nr:hypothetical protein [Nevskiales bacterium]
MNPTRRRWQILNQQMREGHEPCFSTDKRQRCNEAGCRWRGECRSLRASWRR